MSRSAANIGRQKRKFRKIREFGSRGNLRDRKREGEEGENKVPLESGTNRTPQKKLQSAQSSSSAARLSAPRAAPSPAQSPPSLSPPCSASGFHSSYQWSPEPDPISAARNRASRVAAGCSRPGCLPGGSSAGNTRPGLDLCVGSAAGASGKGLAWPGSDLPGRGRAGAAWGASAGLLGHLWERRWSVKEGARRLKEREGPGMGGTLEEGGRGQMRMGPLPCSVYSLEGNLGCA